MLDYFWKSNLINSLYLPKETGRKPRFCLKMFLFELQLTLSLSQIKGYKVIYGPSNTWYDPSTWDTKISMDSKTELTGLKKYTNYTVTVLAFTNGGDGVKSQVHTAVTEQDVPGPPSSVKALAMSQDSILVSW